MVNELLHNRVSRKKWSLISNPTSSKKCLTIPLRRLVCPRQKLSPGDTLAEFPALTNLWKKHLKKYVALVRELGADDACIVKVGNFIKGGA